MGGEVRVYLGQRRVLYLRLRVVRRKEKRRDVRDGQIYREWEG